MTTPLYPTFRKRIDDEFERLITKQVIPWSFLTSGRPFKISRFDGRQISYEGIKFEGSPQHVFWSRYIEPFLEDICVSEISAAVELATERMVDGPHLLREVQDLLNAGCRRTYASMADVDRRLRGSGFPEKVRLRSTDYEYQQMEQFVRERVDAEIAMWKPMKATENWFSKNKFWVWMIGITVALISIVIGSWGGN